MQFYKDIQSKHKSLFLQVRNLLLSKKGIVETKKEHTTTYTYNSKRLCHLRTMPHGVDIVFLNGEQLTDYLNLLIGIENNIRVLPLKAFNEVIVQHFVKEAMQLNIKKEVFLL